MGAAETSEQRRGKQAVSVRRRLFSAFRPTPPFRWRREIQQRGIRRGRLIQAFLLSYSKLLIDS